MLPFLLVAILEGRHQTALILFLAAAISDIVDGFLARHFKMGSRLGAYLDPIADKLFLVSSFLVYTLKTTPSKMHIPVWLLVVTVFRDVMMVVVALVMLLSLNIRDFPPSALGKATTFLEISTVVALLVINLGWLPPIVAEVCFRLVLIFVVASGLHYTWKMLTRLPSQDGEKG